VEPAQQQVLVSGVLAGLEYGLAAVGLTLIFGLTRVLNLAHGAFFALGAYLTYQSTALGLPAFVGVVPAAVAGALVGGAVDRTLVRPLRTDAFRASIALLGLAIVAEEGYAALWGAASHSVPFRLPTLLIGRIVLSEEQIIAAAVAAVALCSTAVWMSTRPGLAFKAIAADREIAELAGVHIDRVETATFSLACAMAAMAGSLVSPFLTISPTMGRAPLVLILAMVAIGGPGRFWGTLGGSLLVGLTATVAGFYLAAPWPSVAILVLTAAALVWRGGWAPGRARRP
jgi:branched-chain amino acid transport system permease protein